MNKANVQSLPTENQFLAGFIVIWAVIFSPSTYKIGMINILLYRCFRIFSDFTKFHLEMVKLMNIFKSNGYPKNFINNYFKTFLDNK